MNGHLYGEEEPLEECPYCATTCHADFVDVGIGFTQCGPYYCTECGASEIGPYDKERALTDEERKTGWYAPSSDPGSSANVIGGKVVGYREMLDTYREAFTGNPQWEDQTVVNDWWNNIRKKDDGL